MEEVDDDIIHGLSDIAVLNEEVLGIPREERIRIAGAQSVRISVKES